MNRTYPELNAVNQVTMKTLEQTIVDRLLVLQDDPRCYFNLDRKHVMIKVQHLINTRSRPTGIVNANKLMHLAKSGEGSKREPILVKSYDRVRWLVLDGNSTTINAVYSGWSHVPCAVTENTA